MRVYKVTEYTPQPIGYKLVPFNGMKMQYDKGEAASFLAVAKSKSELPKPPSGRIQEVYFLGYASSVSAWSEKVAKEEEQKKNAQEEKMRDRVARILNFLLSVGVHTDHAQVIAENVYLFHGKNRKSFFRFHENSQESQPLAVWLKTRGYTGEQRNAIERFLRSEEAQQA